MLFVRGVIMKSNLQTAVGEFTEWANGNNTSVTSIPDSAFTPLLSGLVSLNTRIDAFKSPLDSHEVNWQMLTIHVEHKQFTTARTLLLWLCESGKKIQTLLDQIEKNLASVTTNAVSLEAVLDRYKKKNDEHLAAVTKERTSLENVIWQLSRDAKDPAKANQRGNISIRIMEKHERLRQLDLILSAARDYEKGKYPVSGIIEKLDQFKSVISPERNILNAMIKPFDDLVEDLVSMNDQDMATIWETFYDHSQSDFIEFQQWKSNSQLFA